MLYPSSFHEGIPGYPVALDHLYELVNQSTKRAVERMQGTGTVVRPWIQDFRDYAFDRRIFSPQEIRDQMKGVLDAGGKGWMLWNARARYTQEALKHVTVNSPVEWSYFTAKVNPRCHTGPSHPGPIELRGSFFHAVIKPVFVQNRSQPLVEGMPGWGGQLPARNPHRPLRLSLPFPERHVTKVGPVFDVRFGRTIVPALCAEEAEAESEKNSENAEADPTVWEGRFGEARLNLKNAVNRDLVLYLKMNHLRNTYLTEDDGTTHARIQQQLLETQQEIESNSKDVQSARQAMETLQAEAEKEGVPSGTIRDLVGELPKEESIVTSPEQLIPNSFK